MNQLQRLRHSLNQGPDYGLIISNNDNVKWLTGFTGSFGMALVSQSHAVFITDSRYTIQAQEQVKDFEVVSFSTPKTSEQEMAEALARMGVKTAGFEGSITVSTLERWKSSLNSVRLEMAPSLIEPLRMIKSADEIEKIAEACRLADACFNHILPHMQVGVAELDISIEIEFFFRRQGAKPAFDPIVASGPNGARPHAVPSERKFKDGDFVTLDFGAQLNGYNSDITRTVCIGKADARMKEVYELVLRAETECCQMLVPGANGRDIDLHARKVLDELDLSKYFGHSLGHGLGTQVHDFGRLSCTTDQPIMEGQVFTVEPGVYIEGWTGLRIEDDVVVTSGAPRILNASPKTLIEL